jgi:histidine triad (HIT) family protein
MNQKPCVFCEIAGKRIQAKIVYEDEDCLAFLDINPRSKGMSIVIPKKHYKEFYEDFETSKKVFEVAQKVGKMILNAFNPLTLNFSIIPSKEVPHFHIRIYPVYEDQIPLIENKPLKTSEEELNEVAEKIRKFSEEKVEIEEKPETKEERSEEEIYWIKRETELA